MAALAAGRRLIQVRAELKLCLRSHALSPNACRAKGVGRFGHGAPRRRLVSCRGGSYDEGSNAVPSPGERLYSGALNPMEASFSDEFLQLSLEEGEGDEVLCGISERVVLDVKKSAIELLAVRAFTVSELRKKLLGKMYPVDTVDSVIADFKSRCMRLFMLTHGGDYLLLKLVYKKSCNRTEFSDANYFRSLCGIIFTIPWQSSTWGPKRIKQALRQKGVPELEADEATRSVFQDGNEDQTKHGISEASMERLFAQASKQWQRGQSLPLENRRARIVRWLQYRGFNWAVTNAIVSKLVAQHPP